MKDKSVDELQEISEMRIPESGLARAEIYNRFAALEAEVNSVDMVLGNRMIFDNFKTRADKILFAINTAKKVESLEDEVKRLTKERDNLRCCGNCAVSGCLEIVVGGKRCVNYKQREDREK